jgi:hypothetical protein
MNNRIWMPVVMRVGILLILLIFGNQVLHSQPDSLSDVFPLAIGQRWTYSFYLFEGELAYYWSIRDTGVVNYELIDSAFTVDSTVWTFSQVREYERYRASSMTDSLLRDSTTFEMVEYAGGSHELYTLVFNPNGAYPFPKRSSDSLSFFRYQSTDSIGNGELVQDDYPGGYYFRFTVREDTGVSSTTCYYNLSLSHYFIVRHHLMGLNLPDSIALQVSTTDLVPHRTSLFQNYPNPFNPRTLIKYEIAKQCRTTLRIYDILGNEIITLVNGILGAGTYETEFDATGLASGIYFYTLQADEFIESKMLVLLR